VHCTGGWSLSRYWCICTVGRTWTWLSASVQYWAISNAWLVAFSASCHFASNCHLFQDMHYQLNISGWIFCGAVLYFIVRYLWWVFLSDCLSAVCSAYILQKPHVRTSIFSGRWLSVAMTRFSGGTVIRYVLPVLWITLYFQDQGHLGWISYSQLRLFTPSHLVQDSAVHRCPWPRPPRRQWTHSRLRTGTKSAVALYFILCLPWLSTTKCFHYVSISDCRSGHRMGYG